jgi:hypothetical protein
MKKTALLSLLALLVAGCAPLKQTLSKYCWEVSLAGGEESLNPACRGDSPAVSIWDFKPLLK